MEDTRVPIQRSMPLNVPAGDWRQLVNVEQGLHGTSRMKDRSAFVRKLVIWKVCDFAQTRQP